MDYRIHPLDERTWMIEEYDENTSVYMYLLEGEERAMLIDTGIGTVPLDKVTGELTRRPVDVINTHGHIDHIGGNGMFHNVYMHEADKEVDAYHCGDFRKFFPMDAYPEQPEEIQWFTGELQFDLGGRILSVIHTPGHTYGSICILDSAKKWLFTGDTCCKGSILLALDYSAPLETYHASVKKLLKRKEEYITTWPGHHAYPVNTQVIEQFEEAATLLLEGKAEGEKTKTPLGEANVFLYKDIIVSYHPERLYEERG